MIEGYLSITNASDLLGVSLDTIRRWEKKGLVKGHRSTIGHRIFQISELRRLQSKLAKCSRDSNYRVLSTNYKSAYSVVELFAGAGGLALGMHNAGLETKMLVEIDRLAAKTLRINKPNWNVIENDIAKVNFTGVKADIVTGGFPCQAFSYAGKRMGFDDTRGTLFFEYARAIKEINPKVILAENVRGLENHDQGRTLATMIQILNDLGYNISYRVLRAQYLDVAQKRERLVIIGINKDYGAIPLFPVEQDYTVSLREALKDVPSSLGQKYTENKKNLMELIPEGGYWRDLPDGLQKSFMGASYFLSGGKTGMARRLAWDEPSLTLTCNPAQKQTERCHPSETRPLTIREYARIQSFPDDWEFSGSIAAQYRQIGNAVPVNLGYHIGKALIRTLDNCNSTATSLVSEKPY